MTALGEVERAHREHWGTVLAAVRGRTGSLDLAEDATADAFEAALMAWPRDGVPSNPAGWLVTTARRKALDRIRGQQRTARRLALLALRDEVPSDPGPADLGADWLPDDLLRLVFTCCHPAIAAAAQVPLTLRLVCGLPVRDIARVLLIGEPTVAARITRAKKKIAAAGIPYRVPLPEQLPDRLDSVLMVVHAAFTAGYDAPGEGAEQVTSRALHLARELNVLMPHAGEPAGLLALLLLTLARSASRVDADGMAVPLEHQDRSCWDRRAVEQGTQILMTLSKRPAGRFVLQAAIAAEHARAEKFEDTDWPRVVRLYDALALEWPSPVVSLNRAAARIFTTGPAAALAEVECLMASDPRLAQYPYAVASRADLLRRLGRDADAVTAYRQALALAWPRSQEQLLRHRLHHIEDPTRQGQVTHQ